MSSSVFKFCYKKLISINDILQEIKHFAIVRFIVIMIDEIRISEIYK